MTDPKTILENATTVAVVGCSTDPSKAAYRIPEQLQQAGWTIVPVHPSADEILGERAYPSLADVPGPIDLVDVFRPPNETPDIARQAAAAGAKALWLQLGIRSDEARRVAEEAGIDYVEDECAGVVQRRFGLSKHGAGQ